MPSSEQNVSSRPMNVMRPRRVGTLALGTRVLVVYDDDELGCERIEQVSSSTDRETYWLRLEGRPTFAIGRDEEVIAG